MLHVIIPMAGEGKRFSDYGFKLNKYLLPIDDKLTTMIEKSITTLNISVECFFIFIIRKEHDTKNNISELLKKICNANNYKHVILTVDKLTEGPASTCYLAKEYINMNDPLIISNSDQILDYNFKNFYKTCNKYDGCVMTYKPQYEIKIGEKDKHSFIVLNDNNVGIRVEEKIAISNLALVGTHFYKKGKYFFDSYEYIMENNIRAPNGEFYISNTYQSMILNGYTVGVYNLAYNEYFYPVGEPADYFSYYNKTGKIIKCSIDNFNDIYNDKNVELYTIQNGENLLLNDSLVIVYDGILNINKPVFCTGAHIELHALSKCKLIVVRDILSEYKEILLDEYVRGWLVGNFEPSLKKCDYEVGLLHHKKNEIWDYHYHKLAKEMNILKHGKMIVNNTLINQGEIFMFDQNIIACPIFLDNCDIICIKTKSAKGDKYII